MDRFEKKRRKLPDVQTQVGEKREKVEKANPSSAQACGVFTNYVVKILHIIDHFSTPCWEFLTEFFYFYRRKSAYLPLTFLVPPTSSSCQRSFWTSPCIMHVATRFNSSPYTCIHYLHIVHTTKRGKKVRCGKPPCFQCLLYSIPTEKGVWWIQPAV